MKKLNIGFRRYSDGTLEVKGQAIAAAMTDNAYFPGPNPEVTAMVAALEGYSTALAAAKNGGKTEVAVKNQKREALIATLVVLANFVMLTAKGDLAMLVSSGFDIEKNIYTMQHYDSQGNSGFMSATHIGNNWTLQGDSLKFTGGFKSDHKEFSGRWEQLNPNGSWADFMDINLNRVNP